VDDHKLPENETPSSRDGRRPPVRAGADEIPREINMMNYETNNGIRVIVSDNTDENHANMYVSVPTECADDVWTLADFVKVGPYTGPVKNGRFAASFKDVHTMDVDDAIRHIDYWAGTNE
jgi:hypothetical protein